EWLRRRLELLRPGALVRRRPWLARSVSRRARPRAARPPLLGASPPPAPPALRWRPWFARARAICRRWRARRRAGLRARGATEWRPRSLRWPALRPPTDGAAPRPPRTARP